ncbi:MAG: response regulator [Clostridiales Family XIII bacterium]|jgi:signal transduction histidine kinase/CheY-like chemotaxis protein|nr:response regulator [Clostridiales Family XIII bacterium]
MHKETDRIKSVRLRAALIIIIVIAANSVVATIVGIYNGNNEITKTVSQDLVLVGHLASDMTTSSIGKIMDDTMYVGGMMDRAYTDGGEAGVSAALSDEVGKGPNFVSLAVALPDGRLFSAEKADAAYAKPDFASIEKDLKNTPAEGVYVADTVVTASGDYVIRCYTPLSDGMVFVATLVSGYFSQLISGSDYGIYDAGKIFIVDGEGYVIAASDKAGLNAQYNDEGNSALAKLVVNALAGDGGDAVVAHYTEDGADIICAYIPIMHNTERWVLFLSVPVSDTPIPSMRNSFLLSGLLYLLIGAVAAIFLSRMQAAPYVKLDHQNAELTELKAKAEDASRAKGTFLSNMSHEIRTPLNAVIGLTAIAQKSESMERKDDGLKKIEDASRHLLGVINDILDMSKIEANKLELNHYDFAFAELIEKVSTIMSFKMVEKQLNFGTDIDAKIPDGLHSDEQRLVQVLANLLSNAVKFTPDEGNILLSARLLSKTDGVCEIEFAVSDSGVGMTEEQQARLFQAFEQADSNVSRQYGGTGLGLAISKNIVEMMDGRIWVTSEPGKGSTFTFTVSAQIADTSGLAVSSETITPESVDNIFAGKRILLAEDMEINREIVSAYLEVTGVAITEAENGRIAVDLFEKDPAAFDLILMDVQMPILDGYAATQEIRALNIPKAAAIPIVAMTANVFQEDIDQALASGMNAHIGKPLDFDQVMGILGKYL